MQLARGFSGAYCPLKLRLYPSHSFLSRLFGWKGEYGLKTDVPAIFMYCSPWDLISSRKSSSLLSRVTADLSCSGFPTRRRVPFSSADSSSCVSMTFFPLDMSPCRTTAPERLRMSQRGL